jgi:hypothetical protein
MKPLSPTESITYPIVETFHSIQGEGFLVGMNAFFVRLGGCDVHCPWCDQKETWPMRHDLYSKSGDLAEKVALSDPAFVIITGGEPLLHNLGPLTQAFKEKGLRVHLETSGTHAFSGNFDWVTFSPKPFKVPDQSIYAQADELKIIIETAKDLEWAEQMAEKVSPNTLKYLQPEWNNPNSLKIILEYVLVHPQWRVSLQIHKFLGIQ